MKKINILLALTALSAGILGISLKRDKVEVKVEAAAITQGTKLYLEPSANWKEASARFAVYFMGDGTHWISMKKVEGSDPLFYEVTMDLDKNFNEVIFVRMNPGTTENNWDNRWTQTGDLAYDGTKSYYKVEGWEGGSWITKNLSIASVTFNISIPNNTPSSDNIYIAGMFGTGKPFWASNAEWGKLVKENHFLYKITLDIEFLHSTEIVYKYVRGDWDKAESKLDGSNSDNRTLTITESNLSPIVNDTILQWADKPLPEFIPTIEGINKDKVRIWVDRDDHYLDGFSISLRVGNDYYLSESYVHSTNSGGWFPYFDMPLSVFEEGPLVDIVFFDADGNSQVVPTGAYNVGDNNKIWKIVLSSGVWSVNKGAISDSVTPTFFAKVLEGYLSCSTSTENGYNAFYDMDNNLLPKPQGTDLSSFLSGEKIKDYEGKGTSGYGSDRGTGVQVDAFAKYEMLRMMYEKNNPNYGSNFTPINQSVNATVVIIALGLLTLGGYYLLSRKKKAA